MIALPSSLVDTLVLYRSPPMLGFVGVLRRGGFVRFSAYRAPAVSQAPRYAGRRLVSFPAKPNFAFFLSFYFFEPNLSMGAIFGSRIFSFFYENSTIGGVLGAPRRKPKKTTK